MQQICSNVTNVLYKIETPNKTTQLISLKIDLPETSIRHIRIAFVNKGSQGHTRWTRTPQYTLGLKNYLKKNDVEKNLNKQSNKTPVDFFANRTPLVSRKRAPYRTCLSILYRWIGG